MFVRNIRNEEYMPICKNTDLVTFFLILHFPATEILDRHDDDVAEATLILNKKNVYFNHINACSKTV